MQWAHATNSYIGIGSFQSEFLGDEYDRTYKSDVNEIRQINFGYDDKKYVEFFGGVNIDQDNEVRDYMLGFALKDKLIRLERGKISGTIVDEDGPVIGSFDNEFQRIDVLQTTAGSQGMLFGLGFQSYAVPHLFEYNDGSIAGRHIQDDKLSLKSVGIGIYYDPIYNYLMSAQTGKKSDWYFSTSALAISLAYAKSSDATELSELGVDGQSWLLWGNSGTYELGWMWGYNTPFVSVVGNIGYHIRANTFFNLNPLEMLETEADSGDILLSGHQTILHGLVAAVSVSF
jgi:hypothetical protein